LPEPGLVDDDDVLQVDEEELPLLVHGEVAGGPVCNNSMIAVPKNLESFLPKSYVCNKQERKVQ